MRYCLERMEVINTTTGDYKWRPILKGNDLNLLIKAANNKSRIIDLETYQEIYRSIPRGGDIRCMVSGLL